MQKVRDMASQSKREGDGLRTEGPIGLTYGVFFKAFNPIATLANERTIVVEDLQRLHPLLRSVNCFHGLSSVNSDMQNRKRTMMKATEDFYHSLHDEESLYNDPDMYSMKTPSYSKFSMARRFFGLIWKFRYKKIMYLCTLKLLVALLSFAGPIILGRLVEYFDNDNAPWWEGASLLGILLLAQGISIVLSSQYTVQAATLEVELKGGLSVAVFRNSINMRIHEKNSLGIDDAQIINVLQIDVERASQTTKTFIELCVVPIQVLSLLLYSLLFSYSQKCDQAYYNLIF